MTAEAPQPYKSFGESNRDRIPATASLAERLAVSFLARQDLITAHQLYSALPSESSAFNGIRLAEAQAELGMDPIPVIESIKAAAEDIEHNEWNQVNLFRGAATAQVKSGDMEGAVATIEHATTKDPRHFMVSQGYIDLAKLQMEQGNDPTDLLTRAEDLIDTGDSEAHHIVWQYAALAPVLVKAGADERARAVLTKARTRLEESEGSRSYWYGQLAEGYAHSGFFEEALSLIPHIDATQSREKPNVVTNALWEIAMDQAKQGLFTDAMGTITTSRDLYATADVAVEIARLIAEQSRDVDEQVAEAMKHAITFEVSERREPYDHNHTFKTARTYAVLAEALAIAGKDPDDLVENTFALVVPAVNTPEKVSVITQLAKVQALSGQDNRPTFQLAFESADNIYLDYTSAYPEDKSMAGLYVAFTQLEAYQDIAVAAIENGHDDLVEVAFAKMDKFAPELEAETDYEKIDLLAKRALARAKRGLSVEEIKSLPILDIQTILEGDNKVAKEAITYFGLAA